MTVLHLCAVACLVSSWGLLKMAIHMLTVGDSFTMDSLLGFSNCTLGFFSVQMQTPSRLWHSLFHSESCPITRTVCKLGMNKSECVGESITETDVADVGERVASWPQWLQIVTTCWVTPLTDLVNPVGTPRGTPLSPSRRCLQSPARGSPTH